MHHCRHYQPHARLLAQAVKHSNPRCVPSVATVAAIPCMSFLFSSTFHTSTTRGFAQNNHYEQLGLTKDATKKEVKAAFYKLSKQHHPDKNDSEASHKAFLSINEAYSVLGNDRQRRDYDLSLLDRSGSQRPTSTRGTLRRTPFRHSAQSAAAVAAARSHAAFRPTFGKGVPHFDSKSHQEMHYAQEMRREERRQARERASAEYQYQKSYEQSENATGKVFRATFLFMMVVVATSFMRAFADEIKDDEDKEVDLLRYTWYRHLKELNESGMACFSDPPTSDQYDEISHSVVLHQLNTSQASSRIPLSFP